MARIRSIKPEFFTSEQVADCSPTARLLFVGMWCFCDDAGIYPASFKSLKMQIFPGDELTINQIKSFVTELITAGLLVEYTVESKVYWQVTGWKHQKIDKPNFKYPKPENSANARRLLADHSPPESSRVESIGVEKKGKEVSSVAHEAAQTPFQIIYEAGSAAFPVLVTANTSAIHQWLNAGCDPELDAVPEIERMAKAGKPVRSWSYFTGGIMDAKATRTASPPEGKSHVSGNHAQPSKPTFSSEGKRLASKYLEDAEREEQGGIIDPA